MLQHEQVVGQQRGLLAPRVDHEIRVVGVEIADRDVRQARDRSEHRALDDGLAQPRMGE